MSELKETIKAILKEDPTIIMDALVSNPAIIYEALAKLMPWQSLATKDDIKEIKETMATKEDLQKEIKEIKETMATKEDLQKEIKEIKETMATKEDLQKEIKEIKETMATKEDLKSLATKDELERLREEIWRELKVLRIMLDSLGARWGIINEEAVRNGIKELLASAGYKVDKWIYYDADGYVYGYASEIDVDIVIKNGLTIMVEITAALKRGDIPFIKRKAELYEKVTGLRPNKVVVITAFIHDKNPDLIIARAETLGIIILKPGEDISNN
ncbi:MAG: DUF3782 domain-containing protein [Thermocladium sp.]|jgi:Uncharacterized conserved protein containing a coiled-coil domain